MNLTPEEPVERTALVHRLDAGDVQAEREGVHGRLRQPVEQERVHTVQPRSAQSRPPGLHPIGR